MKTYEFDAEIHGHESMDAAFIEFPYDVETEFGVRGQVKVRAFFDGVEYRGSLARMGGGCHILGLTKKIRDAIGKKSGDMVHVMLSGDTEPRTVAVPEDLRQALDDHPPAGAFFETLSYSNRKEYVGWIEDAKGEETRRRRLEKTVALLLDGKKHP
ncbi:MAG: DUF1905 domain-containing protein [Methanobacteriota archaeon]|nr:MAG: DUF1905 domain-containing protein [Euryarchaeota archaeon]